MANMLKTLTVGHTKNINGHVVTRWSDAAFEVDTWGMSTVNMNDALTLVSESARRMMD
jgi:hypothetical protein